MSDDMKRELIAVKNTVNTLLTESKRVREEFKRVNERFDGVDKRLERHEEHFRRLFIESARARGDIEDIKENMVTKSDFRVVVSHIEAFAAKIDAFGRQLTFLNHGQMLYEDRFNRIESRLK